MKKIIVLAMLLGVIGIVSAQEAVVTAVEEEKVMAEGASLEAFLSDEFPEEGVVEETVEKIEVVVPEVVLDPADRGVVPEIELYGMDDEVVAESAEEAVLFRFSDEGVPLVDDDIPTTLSPPECEDGEGFLFNVKRFFRSLFGKCKNS